MILYNIQHFGNWRWLPWLLKMLQHPHNQFLITYDGSEAQVKALRAELEALDIDAKRIIVEQSLPLHWCGPSQAKMLMRIIGRAMEVPDWKFFVNLSGSCVPLQAQEKIHDTLKNSYASGTVANFSSFLVNRKPTMPTTSSGNEPVDIKSERLNLRGPSPLLTQFHEPDYFPLRNPQNRIFLQCMEPDPAQKILAISSYNDADLEFRKQFFKEKKHYCGPAWFVFHRSACSALSEYFQEDRSREMVGMFTDCFEPDESFLPTVIRSDNVIPPEKISNDSLRAFQGYMRQLNDEKFDLLMEEKNCLFVRKIDHEKSSKIMAYVERVTSKY